MAAPTRIRLRMYQVGFGDCFLLTFEYPQPVEGRDRRHVLIDFGSFRRANDIGSADIAELIVEHVRGDTMDELDAVVLSHRHKDHMSGFGSKKPGDLIGKLKPKLVVQPWTEDPQARKNAKGPRKSFFDALDAAEDFASQVENSIDPQARGLRGELRAYAAAQLKNATAVKRLKAWAAAGHGEYLSTGASATQLEALLPGVKIRVLGPPTVEQWPEIRGDYRTSDPNYWLRLAASGARSEGQRNVPASDSLKDLAARLLEQPAQVRWLIERMDRQGLFHLRRIVRTMDDALNNTSLILLFEVGDRRLLFSGDAQIENWEYVLDQDEHSALREGLDHIDLYKVGHHGSRNATPKLKLYELWRRSAPDHRMTSVLSTMEDVHGESEGTAVPQGALVTALGRLGEVYSTHHFAQEQLFLELVADAAGNAPFAPAS